MLAKVFDLFTQVERPLKWSRSGLGIGLALTKQLVEMHGGSIEAYSPGSGKGSEFVVRLPMVVPSRTPELQQLSSQDRGLNSSQCRVLVVDDNRDAANTLATLLQAMGNEIHTAYDGLEAIEAAAKFQPEVVLLDLRMPKLNGYDAACRIRAHAWGQHMVLIALTGWGQEEDRRRAQEAGFDHHLVKPVEPAALLKLLAEIQRNRSCTNPKN
jgi:CheY-like chemotaxis protein